jgi:uncharacterized protein (DUF2267 family)
MTATGVTAFDSTIHATHVWLNDLIDQVGLEDKQRAYHALRTVLHTLRDRLPVEQAAALGAQLPMLIRGFYYEGWHPAGKPVKERKREQFLQHVAEAFQNDPGINPELVTRGVFAVIARHVTSGEIEHIKNALPADLRRLWLEPTHSLWAP